MRNLLAALALILLTAQGPLAPDPILRNGGGGGGGGSGSVNVADFGAAPSNSGATNRTAFAAAAASACTAGASANAQIVIPAGSYPLDLTSGPAFDLAAPCAGVSIKGAGSQSTIFIISAGTNDFIHVGGGAAFAGYGDISGFRVFRNDNPTAGAALHFDKTQGSNVHDIELDGSFYNIWSESQSASNFSNIILGGNNTTALSALWKFDRAAGKSFNTELTLSNADIRSLTRGTYTYGMWFQNLDGLQASNVHVGFTSDAAILVDLVSTADKVDNLYMASLIMDSAGWGLRCQQVGGMPANTIGVFSFSSAMAELMTNDGVKLDCAQLIDVAAPGMLFFANGGNGVTITSGTRIKFPSAVFHGSNESNAAKSHVVVSGGSDINFDGTSYATFSHNTAYNIDLTGTSDAFSAHNQKFGPIATANVNYGTATNFGITQQNTTANIIRSDATHFDVQSDAGISMLRLITSSPTVNTDKLIIQSNGSGNGATGPTVYPNTTNGDITVQGTGTGTLHLGISTNTASIEAPLVATALPTSAPATHCAVWANAGVLTLTTCP